MAVVITLAGKNRMAKYENVVKLSKEERDENTTRK